MAFKPNSESNLILHFDFVHTTSSFLLLFSLSLSSHLICSFLFCAGSLSVSLPRPLRLVRHTRICRYLQCTCLTPSSSPPSTIFPSMWSRPLQLRHLPRLQPSFRDSRVRCPPSVWARKRSQRPTKSSLRQPIHKTSSLLLVVSRTVSMLYTPRICHQSQLLICTISRPPCPRPKRRTTRSECPVQRHPMCLHHCPSEICPGNPLPPTRTTNAEAKSTYGVTSKYRI